MGERRGQGAKRLEVGDCTESIRLYSSAAALGAALRARAMVILPAKQGREYALGGVVVGGESSIGQNASRGCLRSWM